ncbi:unnamed protein product, partial [Mesorhabditis belari]|uniref:Uncharacterized protein n=1 Tax=Mesorhabditis belari TaxID=2138241 RepID=A0AAF3E8I3_9BILA
MPTEIMHRPEDYDREFDPDAYLQYYFSKEAIERGTRVSLFALPVFAQILLQTVPENERQSLLDIGAGPTVYSALCFRDVVKRVYLTDYVNKNLEILKEWLNKTNPYDWCPTIRVIKRTEGGFPPSDDELNVIEEHTRGIVKKGGILWGNVHLHTVVPELPIKQVDVVLSVFCLESACHNFDQYINCMKNITRHLRPGGKFVLGSVLEDEAYNSGRQKIFSLLYLTEEMIMRALGEADIDLESVKKYVLEEEGVMFLMASKRLQ